MDSKNFQVPNLKRDLAWIAGGALAIAAGTGAWLAFRHRP